MKTMKKRVEKMFEPDLSLIHYSPQNVYRPNRLKDDFALRRLFATAGLQRITLRFVTSSEIDALQDDAARRGESLCVEVKYLDEICN